jgi:protein TonB
MRRLGLSRRQDAHLFGGILIAALRIATASATMALASTLTESQMAGIPDASPNVHFLAGDNPTRSQGVQRFGTATVGSILSHGLVLLVVLFVMSLPTPPPSPMTRFDTPRDIIWIAQEGPGGGGGGGGNKSPDPPRKAELKGADKITVPVEKPPKLEAPKPQETPKPPQQMNIPAVTLTAGVEAQVGAISSLPTLPTVSQGVGTGGGAGTGEGTGIGPGSGNGLGPGTGGGTGGGAYRPGNGVTLPSILREVKPGYTAEAMRAKLQGVVLLEAVVMPDGSVGTVHVTRSLDANLGLDQEAIKAVRQWRFKPGTRFGQPVPVIVEVELTFTLR